MWDTSSIPSLGVKENEPCLINVGKPQPIEAPFGDKTIGVHWTQGERALVELCSPKADNISMVGGHGLL